MPRQHNEPLIVLQLLEAREYQASQEDFAMRRYDWSAGYYMIYSCVQGSWRSLIWDLKRIRKQVGKSAVNLVGSPILRTLAIT